MGVLDVKELPRELWLGRRGENGFTAVRIDVSAWLEEYPGAEVSLVWQRPDGELCLPEVTVEDGVLTWQPSATELAVAGWGELELRLQAGGILGKSPRISGQVEDALGAVGDPPEPEAPDWTAQVLAAADRAEAAAENGPYIGENGNWFVGGADTGVPARGEDGADGQDGQDGAAAEGGLGAFALIDTLDVSALGQGGSVTYDLTGAVEILSVWTYMENAAGIAHTMPVTVNGVAAGYAARTGASGAPRNGYSRITVYENVGTDNRTGTASTTPTNYGDDKNISTPFNLYPNTAKITVMTIQNQASQYYATAGEIKIYAR